MISLQWRNRLQRRVLCRKIPRFLQLPAVQGRPLDNKPAHSRRQIARNHGEIVDRNEGLWLP